MLPSVRLAAAVNDVRLVSEHGRWSRAIGYRYLQGPPPGLTGPPQPLWGGASKIAGARFTPAGGYDSIYLAYDPITAFIEVSALILLPGGPVPVRSAPWVVISVNGIINHILETDAVTQTALNTTVQEMTGNWATLLNPPTQMLGHLAYNSRRICGIKYGSAKHAGGLNLVLFPDRISEGAGDSLEVYDPHGNLGQRLP
jgi:RES domain-containing protein